jgi:iron complex transport system permease protein
MNATAQRKELPIEIGDLRRLTARRLLLIMSISVVLLFVVSAIGLSVGSERFETITIGRIVLEQLFGIESFASSEATLILTQIRMPRVAMAILVGAAFAVAGAAYQALLRNPLADPGILGISTGSALGAIAATVFAESLPVSRPLAAFLGAAITTLAVYFLGQTSRGSSSERLVLAGMIVNAFLSSLVIYIVTAAAGSRLRTVISWLIGDLGGEPRLLPFVSIFVIAGIAVIYLCSRSLNLLMMGEEEALALGLEANRVKLTVYIAASLLTGAAVAAAGVIGFIGLIVPHAVRLVGGSDNRLVVPVSALVGATVLVAADSIARTIAAPTEIHIGVITALIGAPVFVYLLRRSF